MLNLYPMVFILLLFFGGGSYAQDVAKRSNDNKSNKTAEKILGELSAVQVTAKEENYLVLEANQLKALIIQDEEEINSLKLRITVETGESKVSLFLRITQRQMSVLKYYNELTDNALKQREEKLDVSSLDAYLHKKMLPLGPKIRQAIDRHESEMEIAQGKLEAGSSQFLQLMEDRNKYSDAAYMALSKHSENLERLGFNNDQTAGYLKESLYSRAENLSGKILINNKKRVRVDADLSAQPDDSQLKSNLRFIDNKIIVLTDSLRKTIIMLDSNNIDSVGYRQLLIRTTGELTTDILKPEIILGLIGNWVDHAFVFIKRHSAEFIFKSFIFMGIMLAFYYLSRFVGGIVRKGINRAHISVSVLMEEMLVSMVVRLVFFLGILIALGQMGISLAPVLAGLGVAGFIIGFALQDTLGNFASGLMILVYRPFDVGDMVEVGGVSGSVKSMSLVSTTILTIDHQTLVVPNNKIWGDVINNLTAQKIRRVDMTFGVGYSENIARVEAVFVDILAQHPLILSSPEPLIKVHALSASSVDFIVRPWVKTINYWDVYWDVTRTVKERFDEEGISIPFPQRDLHIHQKE